MSLLLRPKKCDLLCEVRKMLSEAGCCCECSDPVTAPFIDVVEQINLQLAGSHYFVIGTGILDGEPDITIAFVYDIDTGLILSTACVSNIYSPFIGFIALDGDGGFPASLLGGTYDEVSGTGTITVCGEAILELLKGGFDNGSNGGGFSSKPVASS